jgi:hypothetical protein
MVSAITAASKTMGWFDTRRFPSRLVTSAAVLACGGCDVKAGFAGGGRGRSYSASTNSSAGSTPTVEKRRRVTELKNVWASSWSARSPTASR